MARNINGGTDRIAFTGNFASSTVESAGLRFRTTQATANVQLMARYSSLSRSGWGLILNNPGSGLLTLVGYTAAAQRLSAVGSDVVNDGNWHTAVIVVNGTSGASNGLYVDGALDVSANSSGTWDTVAGNFAQLGDSYDSFWASYIGDVADFAVWQGVQLTADEAAAYHKGTSPKLIRPSSLRLHAPLIRDHQDTRSNTIAGSGFSGTTVAVHPRVYG